MLEVVLEVVLDVGDITGGSIRCRSGGSIGDYVGG